MQKFLSLMIAGLTASFLAQAKEPQVLPANNETLALSIYNGNLALVKDSRPARLEGGVNEVIFDGVSRDIQSETAIIYGQGVKVLEQNYSYNLINEDNLIKQAIGKEVLTVRESPDDGENIFERAVVLGVSGGKPILRFNYGIETDFTGRVVFNEIPAGLSNKPILAAKINSSSSGDKLLNLAYLTSGLSWKTDYVANINNKTSLDLTGWVTINNESGVDYNNAKIQLIAGDVNIVRPAMQPRLMMAKSFGVMDNAMESTSIEPEQINSYELYTLPNITTIKDKQNKQISLIEKADVKYFKEFNLRSQLYFGANSEFKKAHPDITVVVDNNEASNLGISLPAGTIRFYEKDKNGNLQFIGSNNIGNTAKEETLRLNLGKAFSLVVNGKVTKVSEKELSRTQNDKNGCYNTSLLKTYDVAVNFNNAEKEDNTVVFKQNMVDSAKIIKESLKSELENANTRVWKVGIPGSGKVDLTFTVEIKDNEHHCF